MKGKVMRKDASETRERIIQAVKFACKDKGEIVEIKKSEISNSLYFTIANKNGSCFFRISDHAPRQNIRNLTISKNTKMVAVERFVISTINRLNKSNLYRVLDSLSKEYAAIC